MCHYGSSPYIVVRLVPSVAMDINHRVIVRRENGWDILLSPKFSSGFVTAVQESK
jgi:hypothetical protein